MWDRVERLIGQSNLQRLAEATVGIVGLGSGGGFVAQSLAMSGIGNFILVDDDVLEEGNIVRHVADRRYIGQSKANAIADIIKNRNPNANVETYHDRIENHLDLLDRLDVLVVGVDGEQVKYIINEACLKHNIPAVYAGVYEQGDGGDVVLIRPYQGPCYACWAAELREGLHLSHDEAGELDYGMIGADGTLEAEPALWLHVVRVASAQADLTLHYLLRSDDGLPANTAILANRAIEIIEGTITPPYGAIWIDIERDPACLVCGGQFAEQEDSDSLSLDDLADNAGINISSDDDLEPKTQHNL
jgi:hypothetical protein